MAALTVTLSVATLLANAATSLLLARAIHGSRSISAFPRITAWKFATISRGATTLDAALALGDGYGLGLGALIAPDRHRAPRCDPQVTRTKLPR